MSVLPILAAAGAIVLSIVLGMAFSAMESTSLRINRFRLLQLFGDAQPGKTDEKEIFRDTKDVYLASRLGLCATLVVAGFSAVWLFERALGSAQGLASWNAFSIRALSSGLAVVLLPPAYLLFVFGFPRLLLRQPSAESQRDMPRWMRALTALVRPFSAVSRVFVRSPFGRFLPYRRLTKSDLVSLVTDLDVDNEDKKGEDGGENAGEEEPDEDEIVYNILDLEETRVRQVMEPINSVVAIRLGDMTVQGVCDLARRTGHSRFPVYRDRIVDLAGYISIYDILQANDFSRPLESFVTPAYCVPEYMRVNRLLSEFLARGIPAAIVVDEYGGSSGWVTREDVLEEIVGEIEDEFDSRSRDLQSCDDGSYLAEGSIDIDDLCEELPLHFDDPQYDTLAGFILMTLGEIPKAGDYVETSEARFSVERLDGNRIAQVRIRLREAENDT